MSQNELSSEQDRELVAESQIEVDGFLVLLFYQYVKIESPEEFASEHFAYCRGLGARGRIIIAAEGINGTLSAPIEQAEEYMRMMHLDPRFTGMVFKIDRVQDHVFRKLFVRAKAELVTFRFDQSIDPNELTGQKLSPKEFFEAAQDEDVVILDVRSDYEFDLGHFRGAVRPNVRTFREFPDWVRGSLSEFKDKRILTYCTGGIRCEKFTGFLLHEGFTDVAQLDGGVLTYAKDPEVQGRLFDGKCYVFDERISVPVNSVEREVVSRCVHCGTPSDRYINCSLDDCHVQHFSCEECSVLMNGACSVRCMDILDAGLSVL